MWRLWMSQSCFSLGFLSQYSLWKLSTFRGYKGYLYWSENGMQRFKFFKTELAGWRLGLVAWLSCEFQSQGNWMASLYFLSCSALVGMTLQLLACLAHVQHPRDPIASSSFFAQSWAFLHTLSLTTLTWIPPKYRVTNC